MTAPTVLTGSEAVFAPGAVRRGDPPSGARLELTLRLRARPGVIRPTLPPRLTPGELASLYGAAAEDLAAVRAFAADAGLDEVELDAARRRVVLAGSTAALGTAFGVRPGLYERGEQSARSYDGAITLAAPVAPAIEAVLGFEDARVASTSFLRVPGGQPPGSALTPAQVAAAYRFPAGLAGRGVRIGVIGFAPGAPVAPAAVVAVLPFAGDVESAADRAGLAAILHVLGALVPDAATSVFLTAPDERGVVEALLAVVYASQPPDILCLGFSAPEEGWTGPAGRAIDTLLWEAASQGITVCAAAGDTGSALGRDSHLAGVAFPAASPFALACGGTALFAGAFGWCEAVWNESPLGGGAGGGGISGARAVSDWQKERRPPLSVRTARPGRGVPDVAAHAAPRPGLWCPDGQGGCWAAGGGTAIAAAIWTALLARIRQATGAKLGLIAPLLYGIDRPGAFNDLAIGGNETTGQVGGYFARLGWDACTGLGSPDGTALLAALSYAVDPGPGPRASGEVTVRWWPLPGVACAAAEAPDGTLWALGAATPSGESALYRLTASGWALLPGALGRSLAIGHDGAPWLADAAGAIRFFDGAVWRSHSGQARALAIGRDAVLWIVDAAGVVRRWTGSIFAEAGPRAARIKTDAAGLLLLLTEAGIGMRLTGSDWRTVGHDLADLAVDAAGGAWAASRSGRVWRLDAPNAVWEAAADSVASRLLGRKDGTLLAIRADGALFVGRPDARVPA